MTRKLLKQIPRQAGLKPVNIPKDQAWYWSKQWQKWEKDADNDIASGRVRTFSNVNNLIKSLDA